LNEAAGAAHSTLSTPQAMRHERAANLVHHPLTPLTAFHIDKRQFNA
jgi:hypothetical protein